MSKKLLTIGIILVSVSSHAFMVDANSLASKVYNKLNVRKNSYSLNEDKQCSQFSGSWSGVCEKSNGEKRSHSLKITQENCSSITMINKDEFEGTKVSRFDLTGGIKVETATASNTSINLATAINWNSDKTVLQGQMSALVNSPLLPIPSVLMISYQMTFDKGQLFVSSQTRGLSLDTEETCKYIKN